MKIRLIYTALLVSFALFANAETVFRQSIQLQWKAPLLWQAPGSTMHVAYFADAIFPDESNLPNFQKRLPADKDKIYEVSISSAQYVALTLAEKALVSSVSMAESAVVRTSILTERNRNFLDINIFVNLFCF